jgi:protein-S-isoprenylcysteine O-methyltransferase Ste14
MQWIRRARPATTSWYLVKTAIQIVVFWGVFLFLLPAVVLDLSSRLDVPTDPFPMSRIIAVLLFAGASTLGLLSGFTMAVRGQGTPLPFDAARTLVIAGPYQRVRNPMAIAGLAQGVAVALWHGSVAVLLYVAAGGLLWHCVVRPYEEADLARTFGAEFLEYKARVPLWIPRRSAARTSVRANILSGDQEH